MFALKRTGINRGNRLSLAKKIMILACPRLFFQNLASLHRPWLDKKFPRVQVGRGISPPAIFFSRI